VALLGLLELEAPQRDLAFASAVFQECSEGRVLLAPAQIQQGYAQPRSNLFVGALDERQFLELVEVDRLCGARY
jgi:hypothetical protein